jgi:hypothetical protein
MVKKQRSVRRCHVAAVAAFDGALRRIGQYSMTIQGGTTDLSRFVKQSSKASNYRQPGLLRTSRNFAHI